ncbi:hypothetical protein A2Z33_05565 [Candidatus Gottesmanbacteria bacterium RBG_16_52_11]|uniref:Pyridoxal-5'-phosphate-dependent protein n=1 Tax=Candidatus Gottesmanbacteria bacterium RBG_16_52_11 TaxID=1798374 RepID=A0A1F5YNM0_9BACT|nr:MAG: hypothetical protein A2Z33_05565 [Candidatus Gottesmanbacteria bacterium RBG_16_52_11]
MIPLFQVFMAPSVHENVKKVLYSGYVGQGPVVDRFEEKLSKFLETPYVISLNSGTSALHLALRLVGVGPGDEIISTPMTCAATNWPILAAGATIRWADIDPETGNIDPESIKKKLTKKTRAVIAVDWGGYPADINAIKNAAGPIPVIEDAAHAFGSVYKNKMVGTSADYTCFSFQAIKHLTCVDGGALVVAERKKFDRAKLLRWYGIDRQKKTGDLRIEIDVRDFGYKYHMNDVNAAIGLENLKHTALLISKHRHNAGIYRKAFNNHPDVNLLREDPGYFSSYWLFSMRVNNRRKFFSHMKLNGIMVSRVHRRNDTHPVVSGFRTNLPGVDDFYAHLACIPVGWWLTKSERDSIINAVRSYAA